MPSKDNIKSFDTAKRKESAGKGTSTSSKTKTQSKNSKNTSNIKQISSYKETKKEIKENRKIEELQDKERERRIQKDEKEAKRLRKAEEKKEKERKKLLKKKQREEKRAARKEEYEEAVSEKVANEVIGILVIGIGIFVLMCLLDISTGVVGEAIDQCLHGLLGYLAFIMPVAFIIGGIVFLAFAGKSVNTFKLIMAFVAIALLAAFLQIFPYEKGKFSDETLMIFLKSTYSKGLDSVGTGVLFSVITFGAVQLFDMLGAKFILFLAFFASLLFVTNISIKKIVDNIVKKIKNSSKVRKEKERELARSEMRAIKSSSAEKEEKPVKKEKTLFAKSDKKKKKPVAKTKKPQTEYEDEYEEEYEEEDTSRYEDPRREYSAPPTIRKPITNDDEDEDEEQYSEEEYRQEAYYEPEPEKKQKGSVHFKLEKSNKKDTVDSPAAEDEPEEDEYYDDREKPTIIEMSEFTGEKRPLNVTVDGEILDDGKQDSIAAPVIKQPTLEYVLPTTELLEQPEYDDVDPVDEEEVYAKARAIEQTLSDFGIEGKVNNITHGPVITRYEYSIQSGTKLSKVTSLNKELAYSLECSSLRIEAPIPGKAAIGIEVPNKKRSTVYMSELLDSEPFRQKESLLAFAVGKDIAGNIIVGDIAKMPHTLISGATGSGKSVFINSIILSILFKATPQEVKFVMIDPKRVEFEKYRGIPHLMFPVVSNPKKAAGILAWCVKEMETRYDLMAKARVRDLRSYNKIMREHPSDDPELQPLPLVVIIIDELADLMVVAGDEVEDSIYRLAQMARAAGMYLIIATQRPSVDVITGVIKANIPSRIALKVASPHDSRTIIDSIGAEQLLGNGDMIYKPDGLDRSIRVQGAWVSDMDLENVVNFIKDQNIQPAEEMEEDLDKKISEINNKFEEASEVDELLEEAIKFVVKEQDASVSMLQRRFRIGHYRAGSLIDEMEKRGIVGPSRGSRTREVLVSKDEYELGFTGEDKE